MGSRGQALTVPEFFGCAVKDQPSLLKNDADNGGSVIVKEWDRPCNATGAASTPPRLPMLLPPYTGASLFNASCQKPPRGAPTR